MSIHTPAHTKRQMNTLVNDHPTVVNEISKLPNFKQIVIRWEPISMTQSITIAANGRIITQEVTDIELRHAVSIDIVLDRVLHQMYVSLSKPLNKLIPPNT